MEGISVFYNDHNNHIVTIDNRGIINPLEGKYHFKTISIRIANYTMLLSENADIFNAFNGNGTNPITNSHLVLNSSGSVKFADKNAKIILDMGRGFELGKGYLFSKLVVDTSGNNKLNVDLSHLTTRTSLYKLTQSGDSFIASIDAPNSEIGILHKSNVRTMNNFLIISNSMIYPRKHHKSQNLGRRNSSLRISEANVAIQDLKSYESFAYQNESQTRRIQRQNKRNYSRNLSNSQNLNTDSANRVSERQNQRFSQNLAQNPHDYYFILTPFINHNLFFKSGRYNLSGFDGGFLTAFNGKVAESNSLGAHFAFSYGSLNDKHDKLSIRAMNFMLGLNYKLDLVYDMFLKARGDVFYFLNTLDSANMNIKNIKPNNLGFGASVLFGKEWDFKSGGVLGIEGGLDYKALKSNNINFDSQS